MAAVIQIQIQTTASGGAKQVIGDLNEMDGSARKASGGFSFLGQAAATALGGVVASAATAAAGAVAGFVGGSISAAGDFEASVNNLAAITGDALSQAGFSFEDVSAKALQLGQDTAYSAQESITAMTELIKGGVPVSEVMDKATDATLNLAAAAGVDLAGAAEIVAKQFGVWADTGVGATEISDLLTQAANASTVGVEDLALGLANVGGQARVTGADFQEVVQTMALIAPNFSSAADAGTSFKTFLARLVPSTKPATEEMIRLGLATEDGKSKFFDAQGAFIGMEAAARLLQTATADLSAEERSAAFNTIFSSDAIRVADAVARAGAEGFSAMGVSMAEAGTAASVAAIQNQGFNFAMDSLKGTLETVQIQLGGYLLPYLTQFVEMTTNVINAVMGNTAAFAALSPTLQQVVTFVQSLVPVAMELGGVLAANWQPVLATIAGVIAALVVPALASFVVAVAPVVAAIMGAIAIGTALYNAWNTNFLGIQTITTAALTAIQGFITSVMGAVLEFWGANGAEIMAFAQTTWQTIQEIIGTIVVIVATIVTNVFTALSGFINQHGSEIQTVLQFAWTNIQTIIDTTINTIQGILNTILAVIRGDWDTAFNEIKGVAETVWNGIRAIVENNIDLAKAAIQALIDIIGEPLSGALSAVSGFFEPFKRALDGIKSAINSVKDTIGGLIKKFQELAAAVPDVLIPGSPTPFETGLRGVASAMTALNQDIGQMAHLMPGIAPVGVQAIGGNSAPMAAGRSLSTTTNRTVNYTANFNGIGSSGVSDAIARSLAGV